MATEVATHWIWFPPNGTQPVLGLMTPLGRVKMLLGRPTRRTKLPVAWRKDAAGIQRKGWADIEPLDSHNLAILREYLPKVNALVARYGSEANFHLEERLYTSDPKKPARRQVCIAGG